MARTKRRQPYDPSKPHDRRAIDLLRNAQVAPLEVDDPYEIGGKLLVMRSTRDDPLADLHDRNMIDEAQYQAGRSFQRDFETATNGPRAIDPAKEYVDGGLAPEPLSDAHMRSSEKLKIVYAQLGLDGSIIVHDVLVHARTRRQMAESRGLSGKGWEEYFGKRFRECLDCLALVYGFAMPHRRG